MCYRFLKQNPISSGSLPTGDDESEGEQENEEENEEDGEDEGDGTNGMVAPSDALQQHFDADVDDAEGASTASSGLTDAGSNVSFEEEYQNDIEEEVDIPDVEIEQGDGPSEKAEIEEGEGEGDDSSAKQAAGEDKTEANTAVGTHKPKAFHLSAEWIQLQKLEEERGVPLCRVPHIVGCGINRHPAKSFWSARYPGRPMKSASWGGHAGKSPLEALILCLRHVLKLHISVKPGEHCWKNQLAQLESLK